MPVGQLVEVLPSLQEAVPKNLSVPPTLVAPAHWRATWVPNLGDWQPGDVVLVGKRGFSGRLISTAQTLLLPAGLADAQWSHCAIYVGNGVAIDAMPGRKNGVREVQSGTLLRCAKRREASP